MVNVSIYFLIFLAYTSQSNNRKNFINEVIEEEDEDKNNFNKENEKKSEIIKNTENVNNLNLNHINNNKEIQMPYLNNKLSTYQNVPYKNTFDKQRIPVRDRLIQEQIISNNGIILQNLRSLNNNNNNNKIGLINKNKNINININNIECLHLKKSLNFQPINHRSISTDKAKMQQNNNINSITNDTSAFTHSTKKTFSGLKNYTEDLSKFRMGLLSAGSSPNSDIIIPIIPMRRPVSNFNFGGGQLWNTIDNNNINNNQNLYRKLNNNNKQTIDNNERDKNEDYKQKIRNENKNAFIEQKKYNKTRNKLIQSQAINRQFNSSPMKKELNIFMGMDKIITKLHKIKIEKGMMNSMIFDSLSKKYSNDFQTQLKQYKNNFLPMFNHYNKNNEKNSKTINSSNEISKFRSNSFNINNKNNNIN